MAGPVETALLDGIRDKGCIHLALIDPEKFYGNLPDILSDLESHGTVAVMVGGSTLKSSSQLDKTVKSIRESCSLPVILFPNGPVGVSRFAHAIFFMSLLNSSSTEYLIESQVQGASIVRRFNLEPISLGYIIVGQSETAVKTVGRANPVPFSKVELAADYALAAQYLGMHFVYLEAGSGAHQMVDPRMVSRVRESVDLPIIVGGGIRTADQAGRLARAGASAIVTGTVLEQEGPGPVKEILAALKRA
ncbi:MAG TPA: geranylgeranylglyceryl/heptaprenylglyceryl phosphate synthase [Candidatus Bathyarchaeia archaeon]|nr:geranylgeranylglyceryl/heptaprenylglyceryl phosphate synthase [Candidatus Bathyarchaeia archaeon]